MLVAAVSGAALSVAFPPAGWWPISYLAPIPLLWLVRGSRPRRAALAGFVFGAVYFGALLYWILLFGELGYLTLVLMSATYVAVFGALAPTVWREDHPITSTLGLAALWTVLEWIRGMFPLGGFGWGQLGSAQADAPMLPLASVTGVWGLSFVVVLVAGLLLLVFERWGRGAARSLGYLGAAAAVALLPALVPVPFPEGRPLDVAAIQVNVEQVRHLVGDAEDQAVARLHMDLHRSLSGDRPDLIVWGEGALDPGATGDPVVLADVADAIASVGAPTIAGAVVNDPDLSQHTSTLAFDGVGRLIDRYDKVKLVPFGEYVPWRATIERIVEAVNQVPLDRVPGERVENLAIDGLPPIGTPICYENSFPEIDREMVRQGAQLLVVTINNASYDRTAASEQHLQMSRLRAVENGRWVVHAGVSGISAFIDPDGDVVARRGLFEPAVMRVHVRASTETTLYTRIGDWVPWASVVLAVGLLGIPRGRRRPPREPEALGPEPRVLVVLPTYDERDTIDRVLDGVLALPGRIDALVVDDGSPDGTGSIVRGRAEAEPRIRLVERVRKGGLASAYAVGFRTAIDEAYDLIVEMDSDLSHRPDDLPRLLEAAGRHDLVIGSRYVAGGSVRNWSRFRMGLSRWGNAYARVCLGFDVHDSTSGYRVYRRSALARITRRAVRSDGYAFQIELAYRAWDDGMSVAEVPITFQEREHGSSKISRRIVIEALLLVTLWGLRGRFRARPDG